MVPAELPLRQRKKLATRRTLISVSQRLFLDQGYRATTLEDIAGAADVTVQTLLRYFSTKEDLALALEHQALERLRVLLAERPARQSALAAWSEFIATVIRDWQDNPDLLAYIALLQSDPGLAGRTATIIGENHRLLAQHLAEEMDVDLDVDLTPWLAAAVAVHGINQLQQMWATEPAKIDMLAQLEDIVSVAQRVLRSRRQARSGRP